jgi:long-chain fatty acid transport protein
MATWFRSLRFLSEEEFQMFKKSKIALAVAAAAGLTFSSGAFATNGILQAGNGMVAHGFGGAGLSNAGEAAAGMDNPALISQTGDAVGVAWSMFSPDRNVSQGPTGLDSTSDAKMFGIPQVAFTSKINNSMSWGIMAYAMGGMNSDYRSGPNLNSGACPGTACPTPSYASPQTVDLSGMIVAPTMSFGVAKDVSVGVSLLIGYENFRSRNMFGQAAYGFAGNEGSTTGYGVKLGVDAKVADGISVGAMVQPKMSMGEISFFKNQLSGFGFTGDAQLTLPNEAGVGGKFAMGKNADLVADIMYYQWSSVDVFDFFGWEDQIVYKVGAEFRTSDKMALRVGFNYGKSPIKGGNTTGPGMDAATANYPFPAVSESHFTLGLGYKLDKSVTFNAYYLYSPENKETSAMPDGVSIKMSQNAFGLGLNYAAK